MFDGLKNKLNEFRQDVEDTAEEKAEAQADSEAESPPERESPSEPAADEPEPEPEPEPVPAEASADAAADERTEAEPEPIPNADSGDAEAAPAATPEPAGDAPEAASDSDSDSADATDTTDGTATADSESAGPSRWTRMKAAATGKIVIEEEDLDGPLWDLEMALIESDVEMTVAERILETIREKMIGATRAQVETTGDLVEAALHDALLDVISVGQFDFDQRVREAEKPVTLIFTGVNGVGKTTSIAKLSEYFESRGLSTVLANGDTYRAGANEQIREHAENLDRTLIAHEQGGDPAAVIYDAVEYAEAHDVDVVLGDTAGRLHTSNDLMAQLEKIDRVVDPDMTLFVDEAVAGQDAVERSKKFDAAAEIDGTILTKADADSSGGAAISIAYVTGKPILFLGTGQGYDDVERFVPEELVASLLGEE